MLRQEQERRDDRYRESGYYYSEKREGRREGNMWHGQRQKQQPARRRPGYGELCRHFHRNLRRKMDDHEAYEVRTTLSECTSSSLSAAGRPYDRAMEERTLPIQPTGGALFGRLLFISETFPGICSEQKAETNKYVSQASVQRHTPRDQLADEISTTLGEHR